MTVSKANFLLTSTANEQEIATFITTVSKILSEISEFYAPDEARKRPSSKHRPPPLQSKFTPFPKVSLEPQSPLTPISQVAGGPPLLPPPSPVPSIKAPSIAETFKTRKSAKSKHSRTMSRASRRRPQTGDGASFITFDPAEDSDYDFEERRLMPLFMQKPKPRKGNSRKALKFLGLA